MTEIWKPMWGFSRYMLSDHARVYNRDSDNLVVPDLAKNGTHIITLLTNKNTWIVKRLDRLMIETFIPPETGYAQIKHRDGNILNDMLSNLELFISDDTPEQFRLNQYLELASHIPEQKKERDPDALKKSSSHTFPGKPAPRPIRVIETGRVYASQSEAARAIGGLQSAVSNVLRKRAAFHKGYSFEYADE